MKTLLAVVASLVVTAGAPDVAAHTVSVSPTIVAVEVYDRTERLTLPVYGKGGRNYVVGSPGHAYAVRIRNLTGGRVLAVTSVDGINVVSGETASPSQSGYVLEPWESVEIAGWRKSLSHVAAFCFTDIGDSYASRTGRPEDVGVIGVAAFAEQRPRVASQDAPSPFAREDRAQAAAAPAPAARDPRGAGGDAGGLAPAERGRLPGRRIGTGHGREETSFAQNVPFERASNDPAQTVVVRYDRRENLVAMGIVPTHGVPGREPRAFPALRFVPDPPG